MALRGLRCFCVEKQQKKKLPKTRERRKKTLPLDNKTWESTSLFHLVLRLEPANLWAVIMTFSSYPPLFLGNRFADVAQMFAPAKLSLKE